MAIIKLIFYGFGPLCHVYQVNCVQQNLELLLLCWWEVISTMRTDAASKEELQLPVFPWEWHQVYFHLWCFLNLVGDCRNCCITVLSGSSFFECEICLNTLQHLKTSSSHVFSFKKNSAGRTTSSVWRGSFCDVKEAVVTLWMLAYTNLSIIYENRLLNICLRFFFFKVYCTETASF